mgnify:CR=1 FL=1
MAGYDLVEGRYENRTLSYDEMWSAFSNLFSPHSKNSSSYKFGFLKSIMDNLYNVDDNLSLTFDQLFGTFTEVYWNLVLKHGIRQQPVSERSNGTYLEQALNLTAVKYAIAAEIPFESISDEAKIEVCKRIKSKCKINVVGALFGDTKGLFYSFSRKEEWLQINPQMYQFICKHKLAIEKLEYNGVGFFGMLFNSIWLVGGSAVLLSFSVTVTGYIFAQYDFKGKGGEVGEATPAELMVELTAKILNS